MCSSSCSSSCRRPTKAGSVSVGRRSRKPTTHEGSRTPVCIASIDRFEVGQHGVGRLVAVAGVLAQQALDDFIQGARHLDAEATQLGHARRHVLEQDVAYASRLEWRAAGKAFEQENSGRVEVRGLGDVAVEQPGLLGRAVEHVLRRSLFVGSQQLGGPRKSEIDQDRGRKRRRRADDHVFGADIAVQHAARMRLSQPLEKAAPQRQYLRQRQFPLVNPLAQRDAGRELPDHEDRIAVAAEIEEARTPRDARPGGAPRPRTRVASARRGAGRNAADLEDHLLAELSIESQQGAQIAGRP